MLMRVYERGRCCARVTHAGIEDQCLEGAYPLGMHVEFDMLKTRTLRTVGSANGLASEEQYDGHARG